MEGFKSWAFSLCCAAAAGAMLSLLAPDSSTGKVFRFSIRVFLLCCLILPLGSLRRSFLTLPEIRLEAQDNAAEISRVVSRQIEDKTAYALETIAEGILKQQKIPYEKIEAIVNTSDDGSISISCIRISPSPDIREDSPETLYSSALELIREATGVEPELAAENGGKEHES